jgi:hypothetical protein
MCGAEGSQGEVMRGPTVNGVGAKKAGEKKAKKAPTSEPFFSWFLEIPWMRKN